MRVDNDLGRSQKSESAPCKPKMSETGTSSTQPIQTLGVFFNRMIEIRYSAPDEALDISGTVSELQSVRCTVLEVARSGVPVELEADASVNPQPYETALSKLIVAAKTHPTNVSVANGAVRIDGAPNCLEVLASFMDFKADAKKGDHAHYEYYEGNNWIAPDSVPLVISVR